MSDYDSRWNEAEEARMNEEMSEQYGPNWRGLVDSDETDMYAVGFCDPQTWAVIVDAVLHTLGLVDSQRCSSCYFASCDAFGYESMPPLVECPIHGEQSRRSTYATPGADPYDVDVLACGCHVACFGPGEPLDVIKCTENRTQYAQRLLREHGIGIGRVVS